jgi:hypothetical protein
MAKIIKDECPKCHNLKDQRAKGCLHCYRNQSENVAEKPCTKCGKSFPINNFRIKRKKNVSGFPIEKVRSWCRDCEKKDCIIRARKRRRFGSKEVQLTAEQIKLNKLKSLIRVRIKSKNKNCPNLDELVNLYIAQTNCPICLKDKRELGKLLSVDHCHTNGTIRGFLCSNCNAGLGMFKDNPDNVKRALKYLLA